MKIQRTARTFAVLAAAFVSAALQQGALGASTPLTLTEPYLLSLKPSTEMSVCWLLSAPAVEAYVEYGSTRDYGRRARAVQHRIVGFRKSADRLRNYDPDPEKNPEFPVFQMIARLTGLEPGRTYHYRTVTRTAGGTRTGAGYHFKTAPARGVAVQFALLSDLQLKPEILQTVKLVGQSQPDFIIYNGDFVNTAWKAGEWFALPDSYSSPSEAGKEWFTAMQQTEGGSRLLQYIPVFPCPGNHEVTDQRVLADKARSLDRSLWDYGIYMQLFRPLYPDQQYGAGGKHWYSADFGDIHIVSLSAIRWHPWNGFEAPGWQIFDDIRPGSDQYEWLSRDLSAASAGYIWVAMHWHMFNRGEDGHVPFSPPKVDPSDAAKAVYPEPDACHAYLKPLFERHRVAGVSYGHSHVYERYLVNGVSYIEAASIGNSYRRPDDPFHPSGCRPVVEENRFRSFMMLSFGSGRPLSGRGIQASAAPGVEGYVGRVFDSFEFPVEEKRE